MDKVAIVVGASKGLGFVTARAFFEAGWRVVMASRDTAKLAHAAVDIDPDAQYRTDRLVAIRCDVTVPNRVGNLMHDTMDKFGRIDALICNAGMQGVIGPFDSASIMQWSDVIDTNLLGTAYCIYHALPFMREQGYGKIVTLSGGGATNARPMYSAYAASKTAIVRLTETLAEELIGTHIDINSVAPGALNTDMMQEAINAGPDKNGRLNWVALQAQQASGGSSIENAAQLILHLSSPQTDGISGCLFSAVWDNWKMFTTESWHQYSGNNKYKLRRIVDE